MTDRDTRLARSPGPVSITWGRWRDPENPKTHRPVLELHKGLQRVLVGPDDVPNLIDALERMGAAWEDQP